MCKHTSRFLDLVIEVADFIDGFTQTLSDLPQRVELQRLKVLLVCHIIIYI